MTNAPGETREWEGIHGELSDIEDYLFIDAVKIATSKEGNKDFGAWGFHEEKLKLLHDFIKKVENAAEARVRGEERARIASVIESMIQQPRKFTYSNYKGINMTEFESNRVLEKVLLSLPEREGETL